MLEERLEIHRRFVKSIPEQKSLRSPFVVWIRNYVPKNAIAIEKYTHFYPINLSYCVFRDNSYSIGFQITIQ